MTNSFAVGVCTPLPLVDGAKSNSAAIAVSACWLKSRPSSSSSGKTHRGMIRSVTSKRLTDQMTA